MTTAVKIPDVGKVITLADKRYTHRFGDEPAPPEYVEALAHAVQQQIIDQLPAGGGVADTGEVERLRAELATVTRERDTHARALDKQAAPLKSLKTEIEGLRADLATAVQTATTWQSECNRLREEESAVLKAAIADRDEARRLLEEKPAAETPGHLHRYPWLDPKSAPKPCSCGQVWPRGIVRSADGRPSAPEPFDDLFANIRVQLSGDPEWSS